jgi:hypothetical protein
MLGGIGEGLRHHVVRGQLDPFRQPSLRPYIEVDGHGRSAGQRLDRGPESALGQDRRVDPTRDLAEVLERGVQPLGDLRHLTLHIGQFGWHRQLRGPELEAE